VYRPSLGSKNHVPNQILFVQLFLSISLPLTHKTINAHPQKHSSKKAKQSGKSFTNITNPFPDLSKSVFLHNIITYTNFIKPTSNTKSLLNTYIATLTFPKYLYKSTSIILSALINFFNHKLISNQPQLMNFHILPPKPKNDDSANLPILTLTLLGNILIDTLNTIPHIILPLLSIKSIPFHGHSL
jgi:hypothetical protein